MTQMLGLALRLAIVGVVIGMDLPVVSRAVVDAVEQSVQPTTAQLRLRPGPAR